ncbi:serine protease [Exiguobacterium sp. s59]|uniref:serine protease n=1 Tax=Exiguobacterium sp. s59 TaxID=2751269 RepID=UPI001BE65C7C|nr:serine protease [Exiguobacterium sp. s59]
MNFRMESVKSLLIKMYYNESYLSSATAFIATSPSGPVLLTNRHNVTGKNNITGDCLSKRGAVPNKIKIYHNKVDELGSNIAKVENLYRDIDSLDEPLWIEHPEWNSSVDFVALKLTSLEDVELYPYNLDEGNHMIIGVAETVSVVGFPFGIEVGSNTAIWATGFIASEPELDYRNLPLFLIDCRSRQGQSGSAVVAYRPSGNFNMPGGYAITGGPMTKFLGIYSGRINSESDIGLVWKASAIKELVNSI